MSGIFLVMDPMVDFPFCRSPKGPGDVIALLTVLALFMLMGWWIRRRRQRRK